MPFPPDDPSLPKSKIKAQLDRIVVSPGFQSTARTRDFLRFIVDYALSGRSNEIKGSTIAMEVLGRNEQFSAANDPIVSIEARKLREALTHYYHSDGRSDPIEISVPTGAYLPKFRWRSADLTLADTLVDQATHWKPTLQISPFLNVSGDPSLDDFCRSLTDEILVSLSQYREIRVFFHGDQKDESTGIMHGTLRRSSPAFKISVRLENPLNGICVWAAYFPCPDPFASNAPEELLGRKIAARIGGDHSALISALIPEVFAKLPSQEMSSYEAMIAYYHFDRHRSLNSLEETNRLLRSAISRDPGNGLLKAMLASTRIFTFAFALEPGSDAITEALDLATQAIRLDPKNQFCHETFAWTLFHSGQRVAAIDALDRALALNPESSYRVALIGWDLMLCGEWQRGREILQSAMELNPGNPSWLWFSCCFDDYRSGNYPSALTEINRPDLPRLFWIPLMRAAIQVRLGMLEEAQKSIQETLVLRPDLPILGSSLIARFIKERSFFDNVIAALAEAGLPLSKSP